MTDIPALIARVRELDAAATKGPWRVAPDPGGPACGDCGGGGDSMGAHLIAHGSSNNIGLAVVLDDDRENANAELLAEFRDAAPALATALEAAMAENERLRVELEMIRDAAADAIRDNEHVGFTVRTLHALRSIKLKGTR